MKIILYIVAFVLCYNNSLSLEIGNASIGCRYIKNYDITRYEYTAKDKNIYLLNNDITSFNILLDESTETIEESKELVKSETFIRIYKLIFLSKNDFPVINLKLDSISLNLAIERGYHYYNKKVDFKKYKNIFIENYKKEKIEIHETRWRRTCLVKTRGGGMYLLTIGGDLFPLSIDESRIKLILAGSRGVIEYIY